MQSHLAFILVECNQAFFSFESAGFQSHVCERVLSKMLIRREIDRELDNLFKSKVGVLPSRVALLENSDTISTKISVKNCWRAFALTQGRQSYLGHRRP